MPPKTRRPVERKGNINNNKNSNKNIINIKLANPHPPPKRRKKRQPSKRKQEAIQNLQASMEQYKTLTAEADEKKVKLPASLGQSQFNISDVKTISQIEGLTQEMNNKNSQIAELIQRGGAGTTNNASTVIQRPGVFAPNIPASNVKTQPQSQTQAQSSPPSEPRSAGAQARVHSQGSSSPSEPRAPAGADRSAEADRNSRDAVVDRELNQIAGQITGDTNQEVTEPTKPGFDELKELVNEALKEPYETGDEGVFKKTTRAWKLRPTTKVKMLIRALRKQSTNLSMNAINNITEIIQAVSPEFNIAFQNGNTSVILTTILNYVGISEVPETPISTNASNEAVRKALRFYVIQAFETRPERTQEFNKLKNDIDLVYKQNLNGYVLRTKQDKSVVNDGYIFDINGESTSVVNESPPTSPPSEPRAPAGEPHSGGTGSGIITGGAIREPTTDALDKALNTYVTQNESWLSSSDRETEINRLKERYEFRYNDKDFDGTYIIKDRLIFDRLANSGAYDYQGNLIVSQGGLDRASEFTPHQPNLQEAPSTMTPPPEARSAAQKALDYAVKKKYTSVAQQTKQYKKYANIVELKTNGGYRLYNTKTQLPIKNFFEFNFDEKGDFLNRVYVPPDDPGIKIALKTAIDQYGGDYDVLIKQVVLFKVQGGWYTIYNQDTRQEMYSELRFNKNGSLYTPPPVNVRNPITEPPSAQGEGDGSANLGRTTIPTTPVPPPIPTPSNSTQRALQKAIFIKIPNNYVAQREAYNNLIDYVELRDVLGSEPPIWKLYNYTTKEYMYSDIIFDENGNPKNNRRSVLADLVKSGDAPIVTPSEARSENNTVSEFTQTTDRKVEAKPLPTLKKPVVQEMGFDVKDDPNAASSTI